MVNAESDDGGLDEFQLFSPKLPLQVRNLSLKLLDPLGLPHDHSGELVIGRTSISRDLTMINEMEGRSTSYAGDLTSYLKLTQNLQFYGIEHR